MKSRLGSALGLIVTLTVVGSAAAFWIIHLRGLAKGDPPKAPVPATQTGPVKEADLNIITLTPQAEERLGIKLEHVVKQRVDRVRLLSGEMVLPTGQAITVAAPIAASVKVAGRAMIVGQEVKAGDPMFTLVPLLTTEARTSLMTALVDAEGLVKGAEVQVKAAAIALERAATLAEADAGSKKAVDEAQAQFDVANKARDAAAARRDVLDKAIKSADSGAAVSMTIDAPQSGMVRNVFAAQGQLVAAGAPLIELVDQNVLWLRVPVYVGALSEIVQDRPAFIGPLGAAPGSEETSVKPIAPPASANVLGATRDLYYHVDNKAGLWAPGQRVAVRLAMQGDAESLVVPWSAVVFDIQGGAWVYECVGPQSYVRHRVQVRYVDGARAVLASGPEVGKSIVAQGVAELFGKEMGFGK